MQKYPQIQSLKEANLLLGTRRTFGIYQIRDGSPGDNYAFMNILRPFLRFLASWFIYYALWSCSDRHIDKYTIKQNQIHKIYINVVASVVKNCRAG